MAGGGGGVAAAEKEALDDVRGFISNFCSVEMGACGGVGRKGREKEVEIGLECGVWLVFGRVCAVMRTVNWSCVGWEE